MAAPGAGDRTAVIDLRLEDRSVEISVSDFDQLVQGFARGLKRRGIAPGDRVGFLCENRWEMLAGYLGTMYMGGVAVPLNHKFPGETIEHITREADLTLMLFDEPRRSLVPRGVRAIGFDDAGGDRFEAFIDPGSIDVFDPDENDLAQILYTSGSTGIPKGVPLTHKGQLWALSKHFEPLVENEASVRSLIVAPLYHMSGLFFSSVCLLNATTIVSLHRFDAASYVDAVALYRCSHLSGVPSIFAMVAALDARSRSADLTCVRSIGIGSAPLSEALLRQIRKIFPAAEISNSYGTTEAGPSVFGAHPAGIPRPMLSVGYPFDDVQWRLVGESSPDEGALELQTIALAKSYLNRPDADTERFENGWFKTNDIMRRDYDGFFYFISRADDMFVCGGENIYPGEVEALLNRHSAVQQSLVVGAPDNIKGMVPVAFVVRMPDAPLSEAEIKAFCIENGPVYAHPRRVLFKNVLPVSGTLKIDRRSLERQAAELMASLGRATAS